MFRLSPTISRCEHFKTLVMTCIYGHFRWVDDGEGVSNDLYLVGSCYKWAERSPLRRFISDVYGLGYRGMGAGYRNDANNHMPEEFFTDMYFASQAVRVPVDGTKPYYPHSRYLTEHNEKVSYASLLYYECGLP